MGKDAEQPEALQRSAKKTDLPFGEALANLLVEHGMTVRGLARASGLSPSYLSEVLSGKRGSQMPGETIGRIAGAFGLPGTYFREGREAALFDYLRSHPRAFSGVWNAMRECIEMGAGAERASCGKLGA